MIRSATAANTRPAALSGADVLSGWPESLAALTAGYFLGGWLADRTASASVLGEDLAWGTGTIGSPGNVIRMWLASPEHPSLMTRHAWLIDKLFALLPDTDLLEYACSENNKDVPHLVGK